MLEAATAMVREKHQSKRGEAANEEENEELADRRHEAELDNLAQDLRML